jgi:hypothetical protein
MSSPTEPTLAEVQRAALVFVKYEVTFVQLFTVTPSGVPVGRTVFAPINDDWSLDLVQRRAHKRVNHLRRNPNITLCWVGPPAPWSTNDAPHVFDPGEKIPRAVFLRGVAEIMDDDWTVEVYNRRTAQQRARGFTKSPVRSEENVRDYLIGIRVTPKVVRAEGFGLVPQSFQWTFD